VLTFHLIPHTHWDREWYLTRAAFQARLIPVMDAVLDQLERDPEARFVLDGQTILLEDYLALKPENEPRIAALVNRGVLEVGPWYVLSDLLIPSARSLRRNLEEGARDAARFGRRMDVLYSPDAFGHPAELPALAAEFGIRRAVVRRGLGRPEGTDRDFYRWAAPGGETILAYHLPAGGYDRAVELAAPSADLQRAWPPIRRELVERAVTSQIAVFLGADHHAMPRDVAELRRRLQELEAGDEVKVSGLGEFFDAVERDAVETSTIRGELRATDEHAWVLQGVHSARLRMKRRQSECELALSRIAEPLAQAARLEGGPDRSELLRMAWRTLLQCQFHDTLAGTTSDAVQREQEVRLQSVESISTEIGRGSLFDLATHDPDRAREEPGREPPRLVLWNPATEARRGVTTAELTFFRKDVLVGAPGGRVPRGGQGYRPFALASPSGEIVPVQVLAVRRDQSRNEATRHYPDQDEVDRVWAAFRCPEVAGLGTRALAPVHQRHTPAADGLTAGPGALGNRYVAAEFSDTGTVVLTDRKIGRQYPGLLALTCETDQGDLYTYSPAQTGGASEATPVSRTVIAGGPLVATVETRWVLQAGRAGEISIRQLAILHADSPVLRLRYDIENHARDCRIRARLPIGGGGEALAGTALGSARRTPVPPGRRGTLEQDVSTAPAHRFVVAGAAVRRLAVFAPGFFEYEWSDEGELAFTMLRAIGELSRQDLLERPGHAAWPLATPAAQEQGTHTIHLALAPASGREGADPARFEAQWEEVYLPLQAVFVGAPAVG
jgi:alpha-mannosidase